MISEYLQVFKKLDNQNISWCMIKDQQILLQNKYNNELDITLLNKDRDTFLKIGGKLGWYVSSISLANTHAVLFKFKNGKALRIDAHINKVLATSIPWLKTKKLLLNKITTKKIWHLLPEWELIIIIMASLRGKKINLVRVQRAKKLKKYLSKAKLLCPNLSSKEFERYYTLFVSEKKVKLSKFQRLGLRNLITHQFTLSKILISRIINPGKTIIISGQNSTQIQSELSEFLTQSKISSKTTNSLLFSLILRTLADIVIVTKNTKKPKYIFKNALYFNLDEYNGTNSAIPSIIDTIWPEKNENS